ncbi:MAG: oligoendopeptidase F family protein, partial [Treponema sp.]|nr:oligoendopeptidase F family protein [Treponema sp.]
MKQTSIPGRADVPAEHRWNLDSLFTSDTAWDTALEELSRAGNAVCEYREALTGTPDAETALACISRYRDANMLSERLGNYAFLNKSVDEGSAEAQTRVGRYMMTASAFDAETSWLVPAISALDEATLKQWIADPAFGEFRVWLERLLRMKPHILSDKEERVLALLTESRQTPRNGFSVLTNVDLDFGTVETPDGPEPLTQTTWTRFL